MTDRLSLWQSYWCNWILRKKKINRKNLYDLAWWNENISTNLYQMQDCSKFKLYKIGINNSLTSDIINLKVALPVNTHTSGIKQYTHRWYQTLRLKVTLKNQCKYLREFICCINGILWLLNYKDTLQFNNCIMLASSAVDCGFEPSRVALKTIKLVLAASPLSMQH